jgi:hypothetical protein
MAQGCAEIAIRHAWNAGTVANKAKEIVPHGTFMPWVEENSGGRGYFTINKWMKLAKFDLDQILSGSPKGLQDAYKITGILPEPESKAETEEGEKEKNKLPWSPLRFSTRIDDWTKEQAMDWLYEYDRAGQWARSLRMEFGL